MEEILDQPFNENQKDETWINRGIALIRLIICLRLLCFIYNMLKPKIIRVMDSTPSEVAFSFLFLVIIYNLHQMLLEIKQRFILVDHKGFVLSIIVIHLILAGVLIYSSFYKVDLGLGHRFPPESIEPMLLALGLFIIIFREITYYRRAIRLKRLKNTKP